MIDALKHMLGKDKKINMIFILGIVGIALIFLSEFISFGKTDNNISAADDTVADESEQYRQDIENQLRSIIGDIKGVGKVDVMITLESTKEYIYAEKSDTDRRTVGGEESVRTQNEMIISGGSGKSPVLKKIVTPKICGAAVICEGASDPVTRERVINLISAVLGLPSNRISVEPLK